VSALTFTHIGGPTTLIEVEGWRILTDPTFDAPGRTYRFGWGTSSRKTTGPAVPAGDLGRIDAVLLTHDHHADNLDDAGRALLPLAGALVTTRPGAKRLGGDAIGLDDWASTRLHADGRPSITVTATPCRHGPPGSRPIVGDVVGFALAWEGQEHGEFWISGDTVLYGGVREVPDRIDVGTAVLHLGDVHFPITGPVSYTMSMRDGVELCGLLGPHTAIPVHYEGWSHFSEGRDAIERELERAPTDVASTFVWPTLGAPLTLTS
jgi:L-ascorbate metabolism protein UlaG (beta-lactamase superfamily)